MLAREQFFASMGAILCNHGCTRPKRTTDFTEAAKEFLDATVNFSAAATVLMEALAGFAEIVAEAAMIGGARCIQVAVGLGVEGHGIEEVADGERAGGILLAIKAEIFGR